MRSALTAALGFVVAITVNDAAALRTSSDRYATVANEVWRVCGTAGRTWDDVAPAIVASPFGFRLENGVSQSTTQNRTWVGNDVRLDVRGIGHLVATFSILNAEEAGLRNALEQRFGGVGTNLTARVGGRPETSRIEILSGFPRPEFGGRNVMMLATDDVTPDLALQITCSLPDTFVAAHTDDSGAMPAEFRLAEDAWRVCGLHPSAMNDLILGVRQLPRRYAQTPDAEVLLHWDQGADASRSQMGTQTLDRTIFVGPGVTLRMHKQIQGGATSYQAEFAYEGLDQSAVATGLRERFGLPEHVSRPGFGKADLYSAGASTEAGTRNLAQVTGGNTLTCVIR
jgi:hypothetical protein